MQRRIWPYKLSYTEKNTEKWFVRKSIFRDSMISRFKTSKALSLVSLHCMCKFAVFLLKVSIFLFSRLQKLIISAKLFD